MIVKLREITNQQIFKKLWKSVEWNNLLQNFIESEA